MSLWRTLTTCPRCALFYITSSSHTLQPTHASCPRVYGRLAPSRVAYTPCTKREAHGGVACLSCNPSKRSPGLQHVLNACRERSFLSQVQVHQPFTRSLDSHVVIMPYIGRALVLRSPRVGPVAPGTRTSFGDFAR